MAHGLFYGGPGRRVKRSRELSKTVKHRSSMVEYFCYHNRSVKNAIPLRLTGTMRETYCFVINATIISALRILPITSRGFVIEEDRLSFFQNDGNHARKRQGQPLFISLFEAHRSIFMVSLLLQKYKSNSALTMST